MGVGGLGGEVSDLKEQEEQGLYQEEVQKLVDGVVEDIRNGHLKARKDAMRQLFECCNASWCLGHVDHMIAVLRYAKHPSYVFFWHSQPHIAGVVIDLTFGAGTDKFPWKLCAGTALKADCGNDLQIRSEFLALP